MDIYEEIEKILFKIGMEVEVHKFPDGHILLDIDYEKYTNEIVEIFDQFLTENNID